MKQVQRDLTKKLLGQSERYSQDKSKSQLEKCRGIAQTFAELENGIAIVSDLKNNRSYIYSGQLADRLGIFKNKAQAEIETIWERELFDQLNPEDVLRKHQLELRFFEFVQGITSPGSGITVWSAVCGLPVIIRYDLSCIKCFTFSTGRTTVWSWRYAFIAWTYFLPVPTQV
ncbi:hypothetical protein [Niabella hibiscisoli]|uniref:hypothetical protein n=1 Tax=Niabella hibiscisoli TaxID=1825928 RepID=UPI001F0E91AC|nr:hypothetical protein [Niabella hibiscisoli]MCH5719558.1 hypothetical protein [Niabella hibiscisoli]